MMLQQHRICKKNSFFFVSSVFDTGILHRKYDSKYTRAIARAEARALASRQSCTIFFRAEGGTEGQHSEMKMKLLQKYTLLIRIKVYQFSSVLQFNV